VLSGRLVHLEPREGGAFAALRRESGLVEVVILGGDDLHPGDIVSVDDDGIARVLTPARSPRAGMRLARTLDPRRLHATAVRAAVEREIRAFFDGRGFRETRTPIVVPSPGMEPHIRPFRVVDAAGRDPAAGRRYLHTSPEFAMKRLLVGGLEKIFQIVPVFRDEPDAPTHRPEFTMLEWYRAYAGYEEIMRDTEELVAHLAIAVHGEPLLRYAGRTIDVAPPWPRLRVRDLFAQHAEVDLVRADRDAMAAHAERLGLSPSDGDTWDDLYFRIWLTVIEPQLPSDRAVLVTRYPASQAALAAVDADEDGSRWARRFEIYAGGLEIGNAFEELTDPVEQRRRFEADMTLRAATYGPSFPPSPIDEDFLEALAEGMPPAGGIAVGVDRLVMLLADEPDIGYTFWL
jgi:lysyl-tRNA synthetase class 2